MSLVTEMYDEGFEDGMNAMKSKIQDYIINLNEARDLIVSEAYPEIIGPFGVVIADAQKTVLDKVISRLEEIIKVKEE